MWLLKRLYKMLRGKELALHESLSLLSVLYYYYEKGALQLLRGSLVKPLLGKSKGFFFLGRGVSIYRKSKFFIGKNVFLGSNGYFDCFSINGVHLGDYVTIREQAWLQLTSDLVNPGDGIFIGDQTYIGPRVVLGGAASLVIGSRCQIGANVSFIAENHLFESGQEIFSQGVSRKGINIGNDCWIGNNVVVLDGVNLGAGCVVAAGAVVTKSFENGSVIAGLPAKLMRHRV